MPVEIYRERQRPIFDELVRMFPQDPEFELEIKAAQIEHLRELVVLRNAVILKHNYMDRVLQSDLVPGIRGDSLELSRRAAETDAEVVVFLGVPFMAETAKIPSPGKKILIPSLEGGCSLASSIKPENILWLKEQYPGSPVVMYVNTDAATKAVTDVCCASGNASKVIRWTLKNLDPFHTGKIIFGPDQYLAMNIAAELGVEIYFPTLGLTIPGKNPYSKIQVIGWHGKCEVHELFSVRDINDVRAEYPDVFVASHPECHPDVIAASDASGSTSQLIKIVTSDAVKGKPVLLLTECSMGDALAAVNPNILRLCSKRCPHMAQITLENTVEALEKMQFEVTIDEETRAKAEIPIRLMIDIK